MQTSLNDRSYLTLTQAMGVRLGIILSMLAGTVKTLSIQRPGVQLGCFVLFFNCDETFDVQAMVCGSCQVGADRCCFDEFSRLEEGIPSAYSPQTSEYHNRNCEDGRHKSSDKLMRNTKDLACVRSNSTERLILLLQRRSPWLPAYSSTSAAYCHFLCNDLASCCFCLVTSAGLFVVPLFVAETV